ncbi:Uncharacterized protein APZ42_017168 [Daphnia magna]|uniref:Uncharacterized protein n=1 Tax=Daphnia magna TaxID=35525 RepID=A0A164ZP32_9CRUS|nr:Uncharacterized protein APZ42_017168 [Daphnia magna]
MNQRQRTVPSPLTDNCSITWLFIYATDPSAAASTVSILNTILNYFKLPTPISDFSRRGKWPTNFQQWPWQRFPLYFHGPGIVITRSSIRPLLTAIQIAPYFVWDDMYLFGLCTDRAGVHRHLSNEFFINIPENYTEPCFIRNSVMWMTQSAHVMNVPHNVSQGLYHHKPQTTRFEDAKTYFTYNEPA